MPVAIGGNGSPVIGEITAANMISFTVRLAARVRNWPEVLARLVLSSANVRPGDISTVLRDGRTIVAPPSRPAWWPTYEMFVEDLYRVGELADVTLEEGEVVMDLGAHIGTSTVLLATRWPAATVVCYEPNPESFAYLQRNVARNRVRALLHNEAIGAVDGPDTLYGIADASCEASTSTPAPGRSTPVSVVSFARAVRQAPGAVRVVKIDCEGAEHDLLAASSPELWRDVAVVLLEYHRTSDPASSWPAVEARVRALGFETSWHMLCDWRPGLGMAGFRRSPQHLA